MASTTSPDSAVDSPTAPARDPGLDLVRAAAILLMTYVHFARYLPRHHQITHCLALIGEAAPVFFFFAFGMTFDRFASKDTEAKLSLSVLLLYVALAHNAYVKQLFVSNFLFFIWLWQVLLAVVESKGRLSRRVYEFVFATFFVLLLVGGKEFVGGLFSSAPREHFRLMPWGLCVVAGLIYQRADSGSARRVYLAFLLVAAAALTGLSLLTDHAPFQFSKIELSASYLACFLAIAIMMVEAGRGLEGVCRRVPVLPRAVEFVSKNLLVATTLHYLPVICMVRLFRAIEKAGPGFWPSTREFDYLYMIVLGAGGMALLLIALRATLAAWEAFKDRPLLVFARANYHAVALGALVVLTVLSNVKAVLADATYLAMNGLPVPAGVGFGLVIAIRVLMILAMTYFALELRQRRRGAKL